VLGFDPLSGARSHLGGDRERADRVRVESVPAGVEPPPAGARAVRVVAGGAPGAPPGRSGGAAAPMRTQAARLAASLRAAGHAVVSTREPSDGPLGVVLRQALTRRLVGLSDQALAL